MPAIGANRLYIPALGLSMPLVSTGVSGGQLVIPAPSKATRWSGSAPLSAANGRVVIAGHITGPMARIAAARSGQVVWISDGSGKAHRFVVRTRYQVNKHSLPADVFYGSSALKISLVTCGGVTDWSASQRMYVHRDNIVVTLTR